MLDANLEVSRLGFYPAAKRSAKMLLIDARGMGRRKFGLI